MSGSCCPDFPTMMDWILELETRRTSFSLERTMQKIMRLTAARDERREMGQADRRISGGQ